MKISTRKITETIQIARVKQLIEITQIAIKKGFDDKDLYDLFITQPGSPYFDDEQNKFLNVVFQTDLFFLSHTNVIHDWKPTKVSTASQLYYSIYNKVAKERLKQLAQYISQYLRVNGSTTYKTFSKYFSGQRLLNINISHPYIMEGEVNTEVLLSDLHHQTDFTSTVKLYESHKRSSYALN